MADTDNGKVVGIDIANSMQQAANLSTDFRKQASYPDDGSKLPLQVDMPRGSEKETTGKDGEVTTTANSKQGVKSLFNAWHLYSGAGDGILLDTDIHAEGDEMSPFLSPTAKALIDAKRGHCIYDYQDFAYCTMYGKIPNNRLITLRRFATPIQDDITNVEAQQTAELSRMVTWFDGENNSLEDICSWEFGLRYRELTANIEEAQAIGGSTTGLNGWMKTVAKFLDPQFGDNAVQGSARLGISPVHDQNAVYGPIDSIDKTHIRDRGMDFKNEFSLTFLYDLKSIDGINAKAAMIDLLSNVLACTYNNAKFWGGARYWTGPRPSKFWQGALKFENALIQDSMTKGFDNILDFVRGAAEQFMNTPIDTLKSIASGALKKFSIAKLLNTIGRPSIPVMNSLLSGDAIGEWHVMVGNPLRPIVSMGNMIVTGVNIKPICNELGYDDFPTAYKVTIALKHAMPRDKAGIESMMTAGKGRTYWKPDENTSKEIKATMKKRYAQGAQSTIGSVIDAAYNKVYDFVKSPQADADIEAINNAKATPIKAIKQSQSDAR